MKESVGHLVDHDKALLLDGIHDASGYIHAALVRRIARGRDKQAFAQREAGRLEGFERLDHRLCALPSVEYGHRRVELVFGELRSSLFDLDAESFHSIKKLRASNG